MTKVKAAVPAPVKSQVKSMIGYTPPPPKLLKWEEIKAKNTAKYPTAVDDILNRRIDGLTISGIFSPKEVDRALQVAKAYHDESTEEFFGAMLGMPLTQVTQFSEDPTDRTLYYDDYDRCRVHYLEAFGFDPHERIAEVMAPMAGGLRLEPPTEDGRPYNPGNIRWYEPGWGGLRAHVGNEFGEVHEQGAMNHLIQTTAIADHISWFVILQAPEEGGALLVYDLLHKEHYAVQSEWNAYGREDEEFAQYNHIRVAPPAGSMVMFGGGWRWHKVEDVRGSLPRITYGGFAAKSHDGEALHFWC